MMEIDRGAETLEKECSEHPGSFATCYCCDCRRSLCERCTHDESHRTVPLDNVFQRQNEIQRRIETVQRAILERLKCLELNEQNAKVAGTKSLAEINHFFNHLRTALDERQRLLTEQLRESVDSKVTTLSEERETLKRLSSNVGESSRSLETIDELPELFEKLEAADARIRKASETDHTDYSILHPTCFAQIETLLGKLGTILNISQAPALLTASGEGLQYSCINRRATVTVETKNANSELVSVEACQVKGEILSQHGRVVCPVTVENARTGVFKLFYELNLEGLYQFSISVHGNDIPGSPFSIRCISKDQYDMLASSCSVHGVPVARELVPPTARSRRSAPILGGKLSSSGGSTRHSHTPIDDDLILKVGEPGRDRGQFTNIQGICCTNDGHVIVADSNNQCVQIFNEDGQFVRRFGSAGRGMGSLQRPTGVHVTPMGHILVADYDNKWINVFNSDGRFRSRIGTGRLLGPKGIATTDSGMIIVIDNKANSMLFFDANGMLIKKLGSSARTAKWSFAGPHYVAVNNADRRIYVTDFHSHSVKVFGFEGRYLYQFGSNGDGGGQFNAPTGIAVDRQDNVLVNDWGNGRVQIFDKNGVFLGVVNAAEQLYGPQGLAVGPDDGQVYVADTGNHCFKLYRYVV